MCMAPDENRITFSAIENNVWRMMPRLRSPPSALEEDVRRVLQKHGNDGRVQCTERLRVDIVMIACSKAGERETSVMRKEP